MLAWGRVGFGMVWVLRGFWVCCRWVVFACGFVSSYRVDII